MAGSGVAERASGRRRSAWGRTRSRGRLARTGTVGGLVLDRLGRLAAVGDEVAIGPATLRVESVAGRRIETIEVRLNESECDGREGGGHDAG